MKHTAFWFFAWRKSPLTEHTGFCFRVFGWGLHVSTKRKEGALFSERYGYVRPLYFFGIRVQVLRPQRRKDFA